MSYLVFARKYRPDSFATVSGQEHVTKTLANAITRDCVAHAYVFAGPRGVGKTSIARIFAKALNCEHGPTATPCLECQNCKEISQGTSLAVREIDGASHNSVDNVRELIDSFRSLPAPGTRYKVYIIDEVHMLSLSAFNALLKSLEEPPPNTVFILATTELHKIPETVLSRCQRHDFRSLNLESIQGRLADIAKQESLTIDRESLQIISRLADGSMRDAQTLLDRVRSFCDGDITAEETSKALGTVERRVLFELTKAIFSRDPGTALQLIEQTFATGIDTGLFLQEFVSHFRELLIARFGKPSDLELFGMSEDDVAELCQQAENMDAHDLQDLVHLARSGADAALRSSYPKYALEALVVRLATREKSKDLGEVLAKMRSVLKEQRGAKGAAPTRPAALRKEAPKPSPQTPSEPSRGDFDWSNFVEFVGTSVSQLLAEHLRRVSLESATGGKLICRGPEFHVACLSEVENKKKLAIALKELCRSETGWSVDFHADSDISQAAPGSLLHGEKSQKEKVREEKTQELIQHPSVQSLKKQFPGSKIESIRLKRFK